MKTICTLDGRVVMSQDGDAMEAMQKNAAQHPGAVASVVTDEEFEALRPKAPAPTYADLRAAAYPSFADQFDLLYHGGIEAWKAEIQAVKDLYPKGVR